MKKVSSEFVRVVKVKAKRVSLNPKMRRKAIGPLNQALACEIVEYLSER